MSCIFCALRRGILRFFSMRRFRVEICRSKSPVLKFFQKVKYEFFCTKRFGPLKIVFSFFFAHLLGPSDLFVWEPRTLIRDSKRGFPDMNAKRSKMIILPSKVGHKSPVIFSTTPLVLLAGLNKPIKTVESYKTISIKLDIEIIVAIYMSPISRP